jgi:predicted nucleic acid-binding protein
MLLDSNVIIYAIRAEYQNVRELIAQHGPAVSAVSYLEVMGYHRLTPEDRRDFAEFFSESRIISISWPIIDMAVKLRQQRKMSLSKSKLVGPYSRSTNDTPNREFI